MKIIIGESCINNYIQSFDKSTLLYKGRNVLISSAISPQIKITLGEERVLFIWGCVHAVHQPDGTMFKLDISKGENSILKEMASKLKLEDIINKFEGHFVGVLMNSESDIAVFADIYNRKDIFYVLKGNCLVASTDLRAVVDAYPPTDYNQAALASIFNVPTIYAPKKHTVYEGIYRLGVGERIEYKRGKVELKSIPFVPIPLKDYGDHELNEYSELMHSAIDIRSSAECNWVYLSSGWDSSSILALLTKLHGPSKVRALIMSLTYCTSSGVTNQFEIDRAKKIADYFSVPIDILDVDYRAQEYLDFWQKVREPLRANHLYFPYSYSYLRLAEYVSQNGHPSHAVFNGEVSDSVHNLGFSQYATILDHPDLNFREYSDKMASYLYGPSFFRSILDGNYINDFVYNSLCTRSGASFYNAHNLNNNDKKAKYIESFFLSAKRIPFISLSNSKLLTKQGFEEYQSVMYDTYFKDFVEDVTPDTLYSWILHLYNSFHWQGSTIKGMTYALEYYNINASMPFWDSRILSFLSAMPESWGRGLDLNPTKYPLKWMLKNKVNYPLHLQVGPHSYLYDVDPSWCTHDDLLYGSAGKPYFKEIIGKYQYEEILRGSHFNLDYLKKLTDDYCNDIKVTGQERTNLHTLVSLSIVGWY